MVKTIMTKKKVIISIGVFFVSEACKLAKNKHKILINL